MTAPRTVPALLLLALVALTTPAWAQLPVAGVNPAREVPGNHEMPDPKTEYKVMFMVGAGPKPTEVNPTLQAAARFLNTLANAGVPAEKRKFIVIVHGGMDMVLKNDAYKARNNGQDNPNIAIFQALKKAGVDLRVCGQGVLALKYNMDDILPEIQVDQWAMTTMVNYSLKGYVKIG